MIWHGGGGVYFDYKDGDIRSLWANRSIRLIGPKNFTRLYQFGKKATGRPVINFGKRIGMGIGIGRFTASSKKYKDKIQQLCTFDVLIVRDEESRRNALSLCKQIQIDIASDIVFDKNLWQSQTQQAGDDNHPKKSIGIILRDWPPSGTYNYLEDVFNQFQSFKDQGYHLNCFSFDANTDKHYIEYFRQRGEKVTVWNPWENSLQEYIGMLSRQSLFITSRFHGAVIGTCLGIPGICLNIEPKLKTATEMTKGFYKIQNLPVDWKNCEAFIKTAMLEKPALTAFSDDVVRGNQQKLEDAYKITLGF
jgi:polysaccharide pyruvyl transferase WcaK-like protein